MIFQKCQNNSFSVGPSGVSQTTLKNSFSISGMTAHGNEEAIIKCHPAPVDTGYVFIKNGKEIKALSENFIQSQHHTTTLSFHGETIAVVEHILSAFFSMGVHNVIFEVQKGDAIPLLDGSSFIFAENIMRAGIMHLQKERQCVTVNKQTVIAYSDNDSFALFSPTAERKLQVEALIIFGNLIGTQRFGLNVDMKSYQDEISKARTFLSVPYDPEQWNALRDRLKILPDNPDDSTSIVSFDREKFFVDLRYEDEPVRHKILDFLGDIALLDFDLRGDVFLYKPGHLFSHHIVTEILRNVRVYDRYF